MNNISFEKEIDIKCDVDVLVVGGGMAGISAAIAASRMGCKTLLIERFGVLGGMATTGGVAHFCGNTIGQGFVFDTIINSLEEFNAIQPSKKQGFDRVFNHEILAVILPELMIRYDVDFLLHTKFVDVVQNNGHIDYVIISAPGGVEAIKAKQFIDCTGDGHLAKTAGFGIIKPEKYNLPMSLMYFVHNHNDEHVNEVPDGWFPKISSEDELPMTSFWPNGKMGNAIKIKVPMYSSTDTRSMTLAEVNGRRKMMSVLDYHQRTENRNMVLDHCSPIIGIREGHRILGEYILKTDDLRNGQNFDDRVAIGTFYLDGHKPDDDKRTYILPKDELTVPAYDIPLRSLIAKDGKNLTMAGRCFSAEQLALSSARVMTTCSMMGQAVGTLSALAIKNNTDIRSADYKEVQKILIENGANLDKSTIDIPY